MFGLVDLSFINALRCFWMMNTHYVELYFLNDFLQVKYSFAQVIHGGLL